MSATDPQTAPVDGSISVVISTFQRPDACERAIRSALAQTEPPLEVLVCDNGSSDDTEPRMRAWEARDPRVRYLRAPVNSGTPGSTRNLGIAAARGELIAFLDDDDEWLERKLAAQLAACVSRNADVVGTNAFRSNGNLYFPGAPAQWEPVRGDILRANPLIVSSVLVRRKHLISAGGFRTDLPVRGIEDYAMWLELSSRECRFVALGEPLLRYEDAASDRMSVARARTQISVARLIWHYALRPPVRRPAVAAALRHSAVALRVLGGAAAASLRQRRPRAA
jgi:glycosyltransferase involved in cell wall biosynthesis